MSTAKSNLSAERLREVLNYDPATGLFTWRVAVAKCALPGKQAGCLKSLGYVVIRLFGEYYFAHRLAWLHFYGHWPTNRIDHINGVKHENRISNLRDVTTQMNTHNRLATKKPHGLVGVRFKAKKWEANIWYDGKGVYLGRFETSHEAREAYVKAKREHHVGCLI